MLSTDLASAIIADRERDVRTAMRLHALLPARRRHAPLFLPFVRFVRVVRLPFARLVGAWSR